MRQISCFLLLIIAAYLTHSSHIREVRYVTNPPPDGNTDQHSCIRLNKHDDLISRSLASIPTKREELYVVTSNNEKYKYTISVCQNDLGTIDKVDNCAIKQQKYDEFNDIISFEKCLGRTTQMQLAPSKDQTQLVDWAEIWFFNGSKYNSHCKGAERTARIVFVCDRSKDNSISYQFIEEDVESTVLCSYLFLAETDAVCSPLAYSIGGFWIFFLVMLGIFAILILLFVLGIAIKRFAMGAKGWEQIPCIGMWRCIGNLAADGCDFCCRCGKRNPTMPSYMPPNSGTKGNKFGVESSDEETDTPREDEQILPL